MRPRGDDSNHRTLPADRRKWLGSSYQWSTVRDMPTRTYGEIAGFPVGSTFIDRTALAVSGVHRPNQGGISGGADGADSIVVSGGYVDDEDHGDEIVYTGQGGRDPDTKRQVADQVLTRGNVGLARSQLDGRPVRVVRGSGGDRRHSPRQGLRYDGLFRVVDHWHEQGKDGFRVWRFRLVALESTDLPNHLEPSGGPAARTLATIQRIVRSTATANAVKQLNDYTCQVCGIRMVTPAGPYAEAAHIRALGAPHHGPDVAENLLCLCPNDHVLFDTGAIYVDQDLVVRTSATNTHISNLRQSSSHRVDETQLAYHRDNHAP
jgi:putative restriction endonuclease